jgi:hypothetical protein
MPETALDATREEEMKLYVCWGTFPVPWPRKGDWRPKRS